MHITHRYLLAPFQDNPPHIGIRWTDANGHPCRLEIALDAAGYGTIPAPIPPEIAQECLAYAQRYGYCVRQEPQQRSTTP